VLAGQADIAIVGETGDGADAVDLARALRPDVVLMGLSLPRLDGIAATRRIVASGSAVRVLVLAALDHNEPGASPGVQGAKGALDDVVVAALRAGASGVLAADVPGDDLTAAIRAVAAGAAVLTPRLLRRLLGAGAADSTHRAIETHRAHETRGAVEAHLAVPPPLDTLTDREREVLIHVAKGLSNAEIGAQLGVSETTVKTHVGHMLAKLGVRDRVQAVVLAYETGVIRPRA
jgi:DNA-binding NarL/FixJ family response regulator